MKIAVLCPARPNSALLSHFIVRFLGTKAFDETELLVMLNKNDTWNAGIKKAFPGVKFLDEDWRMGRQGLHRYYNELVKHTDADWVALACEDMDFVMDKWDEFILHHVGGFNQKPRVFYPRFNNTGAVCPVLNRGYINAVDGVLSGHFQVDTWINDVVGKGIGTEPISPDVMMMTDYTVGGPKWLEKADVNLAPADYESTEMLNLRNKQAELMRKA